MIIRQGDVLLRKIKELPKGIKVKDKILALGEGTGHSHRFDASNPNAIVFIDTDGKQYVQLVETSELIHEEHENVMIPEGNYEVIQQREYDVLQGIRQVMD